MILVLTKIQKFSTFWRLFARYDNEKIGTFDPVFVPVGQQHPSGKAVNL